MRLIDALALGVLLALLMASVNATLQYEAKIHSVGHIESIHLSFYVDPECSLQTSQIDWGTMRPASHRDVTLYARNDGNVPYLLSCYTSDWRPVSAEFFFGFSWDYDGSIISPDNAVAITFYLDLSETVHDLYAFEFTIHVICEEVDNN